MPPALKTATFWMTLTHVALSTLVLVGVLSQIDARYLEGTLVHAIGLVAKLATDAVVIYAYLKSRTLPDQPVPYPEQPTVGHGPWPYGLPPF